MKTGLGQLAFILLMGAGLFSSCNPKTATAPASAVTATAGNPTSGSKIAYVNIDSLEAHYDLLLKKNEEFKGKQQQMEQDLERTYQDMQRKGDAIQKQAQSANMSRSDMEEAQKKLLMLQQSYEGRKQSLTEQLIKEQDDFQKDIKKRLDNFLESYNKDKHYDCILSYTSSRGSAVLLANKQLDITKDVIDGMNALYKSESAKK